MALTRRALFAALAAPFLPRPPAPGTPTIAFASGFERGYNLRLIDGKSLRNPGTYYTLESNESFTIRSATIYFVNENNEVIHKEILPPGSDLISWGNPLALMPVSYDGWREA